MELAGVISISGEENAKLVNGSAASRKNPQQYIVELELFHQIHCLVGSNKGS